MKLYPSWPGKWWGKFEAVYRSLRNGTDFPTLLSNIRSCNAAFEGCSPWIGIYSFKSFKCKTSFRSNSAWHWICCFSLSLHYLLSISTSTFLCFFCYYTPTLRPSCVLLQMCLRPLWLKQLLQRVGPQQPRPPLLPTAPRQPVGDNSSCAYILMWECRLITGERVRVFASECVIYWFEEPHRASCAGCASNEASSGQCWVFWIGIGVAMEIAICVARAIVFEYWSSVLQEPQADVLDVQENRLQLSFSLLLLWNIILRTG